MAKKILILDDEELIIRSIARLLEKNGFEVMVAKNGQDAITMVEEENFDLIIADIRMPGINGLEVVKAIQKNKKIPTIFITGYADPDIEREAKKTNPIAYLYKPFDISEIMEKINKALGS